MMEASVVSLNFDSLCLCPELSDHHDPHLLTVKTMHICTCNFECPTGNFLERILD